MTFDSSQPQPTQNISSGQATILNNFAFLASTTGRTTNGYYDLPNGVTIQWGITGTTINAGLSAELPFNKAFSAAAYNVIITEIKNSTTATNRVVLSTTSDFTTTGFKVEAVGGTTPNFPTRVSWIAIGRT